MSQNLFKNWVLRVLHDLIFVDRRYIQSNVSKILQFTSCIKMNWCKEIISSTAGEKLHSIQNTKKEKNRAI